MRTKAAGRPHASGNRPDRPAGSAVLKSARGGVRTTASEGNVGDSLDRVVVTARERLAFLEQRPECRVETEDAGLLTTIAYVLNDLTFELHLDWRDMVATLMVGRTMGGQRPPGYLVHLGVRVRYHLRDLLPVTARASSPDAAPAAGHRRTARAKAAARSMDSSELADRMNEQIAVMAATLAKSFDEVCANARLGFRASDEHRALNPQPLPRSYRCHTAVRCQLNDRRQRHQNRDRSEGVVGRHRADPRRRRVPVGGPILTRGPRVSTSRRSRDRGVQRRLLVAGPCSSTRRVAGQRAPTPGEPTVSVLRRGCGHREWSRGRRSTVTGRMGILRRQPVDPTSVSRRCSSLRARGCARHPSAGQRPPETVR